MYLGTALGLIALGAILAFAVTFEMAGINISMVGVILMLVGIIGLFMELTRWGPRRRTGEREIVRERDVLS
ncbi:MAG TPA: DUF6458 family protein [Egibacteraceae bacterium]|nr:DUF6458 family protein [Egibacteraceae bacterium]